MPQKNAYGAPATLSHDQVAALIQNTMAEEERARLFQAQTPPSVGDELAGPEKLSPAQFSQNEVSRLVAGGQLSAAARKRLQAAAKADKDKASTIDRRKSRPTVTPKRAAGR